MKVFFAIKFDGHMIDKFATEMKIKAHMFKYYYKYKFNINHHHMFLSFDSRQRY
jgi:hypothetical protein